MSTADVASAEIYQEIASADAAFWYQAYTQVSQRELLLERRVKQLEAECDQHLRFVDELTQQIDALKYQLVWMAQQLFGKKTETLKSDTGKPEEPSDTPSDQAPIGDNAEEDNGNERKNRGQQRGAKGHGRKQRRHLPFEEIFHDLADDDTCCPACGLPLEQQSFTEDSEQIHW
jgi:transposase